MEIRNEYAEAEKEAVLTFLDLRAKDVFTWVERPHAVLMRTTGGYVYLSDAVHYTDIEVFTGEDPVRRIDGYFVRTSR